MFAPFLVASHISVVIALVGFTAFDLIVAGELAMAVVVHYWHLFLMNEFAMKI